MKTPYSLFLPDGILFRNLLPRAIFKPAPVPRYARSYSALVSGTLRKQLRNHTPILHTALSGRYYSANQAASSQEQTPSHDLKGISHQQAAESTPTATTSEPPKSDTPAYELTFTCKSCETRSTHKISKQGYHKGTILITCPGCKNRHLICDHLQIFRDKSTTIEDILKEKGESLKHGTLGAEGDIEIWDDGTTTRRATT